MLKQARGSRFWVLGSKAKNPRPKACNNPYIAPGARHIEHSEK
jgi:hypothetical protein